MTEPTPGSPANLGPMRNQIVEVKAGVITAPTNIISTVQGAKTLYYNDRLEHLRRIDLYAAIEGLIAGNAPYSAAELARNKLSHIANFNNLDARALYERGALAYWNLLNEAETICDFSLRFPEAEALDWAETLSTHWNDVVRMWPSFNVAFNTLAGQLVKFGVSPVIWPDERDWRWRTVELSRFFVEDQAQCDIELIGHVSVETIFTAQFLFQVYEEFKDTPEDESPWNTKELARLLVFLANRFPKDDRNYYDMMEIQRRIQNGDLSFSTIFTDNIRIVSFFQKEYDGKISHYMFHPLWDAGGFIYFVDRQYRCLDEAMTIFTASPGEFTIHSNRGLGHKIFSGSQAMMQLDCSIIDMARMSATPLIKSPAIATKDFEQIRFYPGVPTNLGMTEFVENTLGENIKQLIGASQYVLGKLQFNTANSGDDPGVPDRNVGSLSDPQARAKSFREFSVLKNNIAHFYSQFDRVETNMTIKLLQSKKGYPGYEYAELWKSRCIEDGVPKEIFDLRDADYFGMPPHMTVRATRVAGDGSTLAKIMGLQELLSISGGFGPKEENEFKKQWVMATLGPQYVKAFTQDYDDTDQGNSLAGAENGIMRIGESPVFSMNNEHRSHFSTHLALGNDTIQRIQQQQMGAVDADKIFNVLIPHMQEHYQALQKNIFARQFLEGIKKPWGQLTQYATLNRHNAAKELQANIRKQQEQQAATQQALTDEQLKQVKAEGDAKRADYKVQSQVERAKEANQTRADVMREKVQKDAENTRLKVQLDAQAKTLDQQSQDTANKPLPELRAELSNINGNTISPFDLE